MSVWNDIRKRGVSQEIKKEDKVEEENSWSLSVSIDQIKKDIDLLKKEQIKLDMSISDFQRELDKFSWDKKNYIKCNYKI